MRRTYIIPVYFYITIIAIIFPFLTAIAGGATVLAGLTDNPAPRNALLIALGLVFLVLGCLELRTAAAFIWSYFRYPYEPWRTLFPVVDANKFTSLRQTRDLVDTLRCYLFFFLVIVTIGLGWFSPDMSPARAPSDLALKLALAAAAALLVLKIGEILYDMRSGRARLVIPCQPIFAGAPFSGRIATWRDIGGHTFDITLVCREELKLGGGWRETVTATATAESDGSSSLDFTIKLPIGFGGIYKMGIIWYLLVRPRDAGPSFHCRFSNLPVFPATETGVFQ